MTKNPKFCLKKGDIWHFRRRIPVKFSGVDSRDFASVSLETTSASEAAGLALIQNSLLENYWKELLRSGKVHGADEKYRAAVLRAKALGFDYLDISTLATPANAWEAAGRMYALSRAGITPANAEALAGGAEKPPLRLSAALEAYWDITRDRVRGKDARRVKKWKRPRERAVNNLINVTGDKDICQLTHDDTLALRTWWLDRIEADDLDTGSANKDFMHLRDIIATVAVHKKLNVDVDALFKKVRMKTQESTRAPYSADFIQKSILAPGALDGLEKEEMAVVMIFADTGAGVSEIASLEPGDIFLGSKIPFLWFRPNARSGMKTAFRPRQIPLVGAALVGARMIPRGLDPDINPDTLSNTINTYLREKGLRPEENQSLYSLRHSFKDRLRTAKCDPEMRDDLMGHKPPGEKYGAGFPLEEKYELLQKIAFTCGDVSAPPAPEK